MKKSILFTFLLILCLNGACSQNKDAIENEKETLYEREFLDQSENWEVKLYLVELPKEELFNEKISLTIKYLKDIYDELDFFYEIIFGDPVRLTFWLDNIPNLTKDSREYIFTEFQQKMIEEVCFGQLMIKIYWEGQEGKSQEESFVFKDNQNAQCKYIVPMAPRD